MINYSEILTIKYILPFDPLIIKIIENQANFSTLVHPQSRYPPGEIMDLEFHLRSKNS